jgi:hypothetical protein
MVTAALSTLRAARELLTREWPGREAPVSAWLAYHQRAARLYKHVANVDPDHQHEALYWAGYERDQAQALRESARENTKEARDGSR